MMTDQYVSYFYMCVHILAQNVNKAIVYHTLYVCVCVCVCVCEREREREREL